MKPHQFVALMGLAGVLIPSQVFAYARPNTFEDKKGATRIQELKRFQAQNNLVVTGSIGPETKRHLEDAKRQVHDLVEHPPTKGYWIAINKSRKTLTLYRGGVSQGKYPVALGTSATPTPSGKTKIINKHVNPAWGGMGGTPRSADDPKNPLGERWMGLGLRGSKGGYGIHGTILPGQIGTYASNGCIRMFNYDIEELLFPLVKVGTPVWIGTNDELASWGVRQIIEEAAPAPAPTTPQPQETPEAPAPQADTREAVDILEFE